MQTYNLEIKKSLKSDFLPFSLWFWKLSDLTYNALTGKVILTLAGYLNQENYQKDGTKACLETKKITLDTQKELVQVPIMRPKLKADGEAELDPLGKVILEEIGETQEKRVNQDSYLELEEIGAVQEKIKEFLDHYLQEWQSN